MEVLIWLSVAISLQRNVPKKSPVDMDTHWTLICLSSIEESQGLLNDEIFVS